MRIIDWDTAFCIKETEQLPLHIFDVWKETKKWLKYEDDKDDKGNCNFKSFDTFMLGVLRFASVNEDVWDLLSQATDDSSNNKNFRTIQRVYVKLRYDHDEDKVDNDKDLVERLVSQIGDLTIS